MTNSENNKKILKNTIALYFRQIITMFVALFTSRIVLQTLGVTDYGINNVVGGVVAMMSLLTSSLATTTQRFLNVELGKNDTNKLKLVFSNSLSLHLIFIVLSVILAETAGLWFLENKLVIPQERANAAFWVYQFSVISFAVGVFFAPFEGAIKAHERFDFYAKISIFDVVMKLVVAYLLVIMPYDKLIALTFMWMCVAVMGKIIMYIYCHRHFAECRLKLLFLKDHIRQLMGYNIYTVIGAVSAVIRYQGINIVLNLYYGPILNAAQGIANTVYTALLSFTNNAAIATQPQIVLSYVQNNRPRLWNLITGSTRLYFYLFLLLIFPFFLEIEAVLDIWLGSYPPYTPIFTRLLFLEILISIFVHPIGAANSAVGKLRPVTIISVLSRVLILFSAVFIGRNNIPPYFIFIMVVVLQGISLIFQLMVVLKIQLGFSLRKYISDVFYSILKTSLFVLPIPIIIHYVRPESILYSFLTGLFTFFWSALLIFLVGLNIREKQMITQKMPLFLQKSLFKKYA